MQNQISSFVIRTIQSNKNNNFQNIRQTITVHPNIAQFYNFSSDKINVAKLDIKNQSHFNKKISIKQPSKSYFQVCLKQKQLAGKQSSEIHVFFNPKKEKGFFQDEFSIKVDGQSSCLFVPIICQYKTTNHNIFSSSKLLIATNKQNDQTSVKNNPVKTSFVRKSVHAKKRNVSIETKGLDLNYYKNKEIQLFMDKFQCISKYILEKKVKNEVYLGQMKISNKQRKEIENYRIMVQQIKRKTLFEQVQSRFVIQYHECGPILQIFNGLVLTWNINSNNSQIILNNGLNKLQEQIRKYTISLRFDTIKKSLEIYKEYKNKEESKSKKLKVQEYIEYFNNKLQNNIYNFEFEFDKNSLKRQELLIDYQKTPRNGYFRERGLILQINQRIGFDNWIPMNVFKENNQEIYRYQLKQISNHEIFMPINLKDNLKGAQMQLPFKNEFLVESTISDIYSFKSQPAQPSFDYYSEYQKLKEPCYYYHNVQDPPTLITNDDNLQEWLKTYINHL